MNTIVQVAPAATELLQVLLLTLAKPSPLSKLMPEDDGVTATEFGFLNVVVVPLVLATVKAAGAAMTLIVIGTLGTLPPADELPVSVPL